MWLEEGSGMFETWLLAQHLELTGGLFLCMIQLLFWEGMTKIHTVKWLMTMALAAYQVDHILMTKLYLKAGAISSVFQAVM